MDYRYIEQLLERYWECQTTLEEENILRAFFSQDDIPASMLQYRDLFLYQKEEVEEDVLGSDFDERILAIVNEPAPVKARKIKLSQRLIPLFKAAAVVAIVLSVGNAIQVPLDNQSDSYLGVSGSGNPIPGVSVAKNSTDSLTIDSMQRSKVDIESKEAATPF